MCYRHKSFMQAGICMIDVTSFRLNPASHISLGLEATNRLKLSPNPML